VLLPFVPSQVGSVLPGVAKDGRSTSLVTMAEATLSDGQVLRGVNDLFIGPKSHTSALYEIEFQGVKEAQSSSGLIVSTGLGSTAWLKSIVTGSVGIAKAIGHGQGDGYEPMPRDTDHLIFAVREPFGSRGLPDHPALWRNGCIGSADPAFTHVGYVFDTARSYLEWLYKAINWALKSPPVYVVCAVVLAAGWRLVGLWFGALAGLGMAACALMGLWPVTMETLALVMTATTLALAIALPLGVIAGFFPAVDRLVEPLLDLVQTLPPYIYLLPSIALMGYGPATALVATVIVAIPPALKLTSLGIRMTPHEFIELGQATGTTSLQMFFKIRLPFAMPSIMAGINQSLMMAFGMVVIAGIVGSGGLGETIYGAVRTLDIAKSIDATVAIVILTMVIDRLTQRAAQKKSGSIR